MKPAKRGNPWWFTVLAIVGAFVVVLMALLCLCVVLGWASPVEARSWYMSTLGSDSLIASGHPGPLNDSCSIAHPCRTFNQAQWVVKHGQDTLRYANSAGVHSTGKYADGIIPQQYSNFHDVVVIGDSANPNRVVIPTINLTAAAFNRLDNVTVIGVRTDRVTLYHNDKLDGGSGATNFHLRRSVVAKEWTNTSASFRISKSVLGLRRYSVSATTTAHPAARDTFSFYFVNDADGYSISAVIDSSTITTSPRAAPYPSGYVMCFNSENTALFTNTVVANNSRFTLFKPAGYEAAGEQGKPTIFRGMKNSLFTDNVWSLVDSSNFLPGEVFGFLFRDDLKGNTFLRDTMILHTLIAGRGKGCFDFAGPGGNREGYNNVISHCLMKCDLSIARPFRYDWQIQPGDSFCYNVVVCSTGVALGAFSIPMAQGSAAVYRNTFVNLTGGGAMNLNYAASSGVCSGWDSPLISRGNIFYTGRTGTGATDYALVGTLPNAVLPAFPSDFNLYSHYGGSGARSLNITPCGLTAANYYPGTTSPSAYSSFGIDYNSRYGSPRFADSSFSTFDASLLSNSAALLGVNNNGVLEDMGARDLDRIRPYQIAEIAVNGGSSSEGDLVWTATGDDSLTGRAASYTVYQHTSYFDASSVGSASVISGAPTPAVYGTRQTMRISGLQADTDYYFAIIATDEAGNPSVLSPTTFFHTRPTNTPDLPTATP